MDRGLTLFQLARGVGSVRNSLWLRGVGHPAGRREARRRAEGGSSAGRGPQPRGEHVSRPGQGTWWAVAALAEERKARWLNHKGL